MGKSPLKPIKEWEQWRQGWSWGLGLSAGRAAELTGLGAEWDPGFGMEGGLNLVPPPLPWAGNVLQV